MNMSRHLILRSGTFRLDGGAMYGIIPRPMWSKNSPPDEMNRINLALRLWLIKTPQKLILMDTGIGNYHGPKFDERFAVSLGAGISETISQATGLEITDVVLSHLHFDHAGGLGKLNSDGTGSLLATFPKARWHIHRDHYAYACQPTDRDAGSFQTQIFKPLIETHEKQGMVVWHRGDQGVILEEGSFKLQFRCSHGHTPHLMHAYDDEMIYLADLIPTSHHVAIPWVMAYDMNPGISTKEKRQFLEFAKSRNLTLIFEHDDDFWGAKVDYDPSKDHYFCVDKKAQKETGLLQI